ncbi:hypothetical protein GALMADRAFT_137441 [Galerina marginata CBS 339.88]|uniref:Uncharacterized protein n=1 Tax=Galerina marginata (strain CBS 339.88) TaxID=685588 RepID=A0A067T922_GALM3|nr:hypothetical protein GALMADRAFT_137441 [Galerina marginata CBS 339.88]
MDVVSNLLRSGATKLPSLFPASPSSLLPSGEPNHVLPSLLRSPSTSPAPGNNSPSYTLIASLFIPVYPPRNTTTLDTSCTPSNCFPRSLPAAALLLKSSLNAIPAVLKIWCRRSSTT